MQGLGLGVLGFRVWGCVGFGFFCWGVYGVRLGLLKI